MGLERELPVQMAVQDRTEVGLVACQQAAPPVRARGPEPDLPQWLAESRVEE